MGRLTSVIGGVFVLSQVLLACASPAAPPPATAAPAPTAPPAPTAAPTTPPTVAPTTAPAVAPTVAPTSVPAATASSSTASSPAVQIAKDAKLGEILTGANEMTLYLYTKDAPNVSNCYDQCAQNWPPLVTTADPVGASGLTGKLGTAPRKDGSKQVTYNGMPLYYFAKDKKAGDVLGQEVGYVWFVVPPAMAGFPTIKPAKDASLGEILTDTKGMTVYRFTKDTADVSNCYDQCAQNWPPVLVTTGDPIGTAGLSGKFGVTSRKDGSKQATYNGEPLYYYAKDQKPGDTTGQNVGNVWFVITAGS